MTQSSKSKATSQPPLVLRKADYVRWGAEDLWTLPQIPFLLLGYEPVAEDSITAEEVKSSYTNLRKIIEKNRGKKLKYFAFDLDGARFLSWVVIEWAESVPIPVPQELKSAVIESYPGSFRTGILLEEIKRLKRENETLRSDVQRTQIESLPPYMKRDHAHFSPDLQAAVSAWTAQYHEGQVVQKRGHITQLVEWISENYKNPNTGRQLFGKEATKRIAMVANPNKKGGAPRSS